MAVKRKEEIQEKALESQIGNLGGIEQAPDYSHIPTEAEVLAREASIADSVEENIGTVEQPKSMVGQKLQGYTNREHKMSQDELNSFRSEHKLTKVGETIGETSEIRDGWMTVERELLGERDIFYPENWEFRIRPATVEAIRNWSTIDEENPNSIDIVFDEILKSCLAIRTDKGPLPWSQINTWDRFFFVLLIREYTFEHGESKVEFDRECSNCESDVTFKLESQALMYETPDPDTVNSYYNPEDRTWTIYPPEYDVVWGDEPVTLYVPTREKDANIKNYYIERLQQDRNAKMDRVFFKFLPWLCPKISKDANIARNQIRTAETFYKSWKTDMFQLMDEVIDNISVTPSTTLSAVCPACGEEVTAPINFPDGVASLFTVRRVGKRFGKK